MLLSELPGLCSFVDGAPRVAPATMALYRHAVGSLVRFLGDDVGVDSLTAVQVSDYQAWLRDVSGLSVAGANTYRRTLRAVFRRGGRGDLAQHLRDLRPPPRRGKAIKDEALAALLERAGVRDKAILLLLRDSGARRGAVTSLKRDDVRMWQEGGSWRLAGHAITKGDNTVLLLAGDECVQAIRAWLEVAPDSTHLFCTEEGEPIAPQTINSMFRRLREAAELPEGVNANAHALRHRFAQRMLARHDAKVVSQLMGHAEVSTTLDVYAQRDEEELIALYYAASA